MSLLAAPLPSAAPARPQARSVSTFEWLIVILGGLPFYLPIILWMGETRLGATHPISWYYWMNANVSAPHVYSTYARLHRKIGEGRVHWLFGFPAYFAWVGLLVAAKSWGAWLALLTAINIWQSLHYTRQTYGVFRFYVRGQEDEWARKLSYWTFQISMPFLVLGRSETLYEVWGGRPSDNILPLHIPPAILVPCKILFAISILSCGFYFFRQFSRGLRGELLAPLVAAVCYFALHAYGFLSVAHYQRGFMVITIFHAVQYIGMVWKFETEVPDRTLFVRLSYAFPLFWIALFGLGMVWETAITMSNQVFAFASAACLAAVSAHHYTVDSVLWRAQTGK